MNWSNMSFGYLLSGFIISMIGMGMFMYGKRVPLLWPMVGGLAMSIYPFFITSVWLLWVVTAGVVGFLYFMRE